MKASPVKLSISIHLVLFQVAGRAINIFLSHYLRNFKLINRDEIFTFLFWGEVVVVRGRVTGRVRENFYSRLSAIWGGRLKTLVRRTMFCVESTLRSEIRARRTPSTANMQINPDFTLLYKKWLHTSLVEIDRGSWPLSWDTKNFNSANNYY